MNDNYGEQMTNKTSIWSSVSLSFLSAILGSGALWFAWFRYNGLLNRPQIHWYDWTQPVFAAFMGILCLSAAVLFILQKPSGWSMFKTGLSMVPLMLFINLLILLVRVSQNILQGNGLYFVSRLYESPLNKAILALIVILILLSVIKETKK